MTRSTLPWERQVQTARSHFFEGQPIVNAAVSEVVVRSWERSRGYGLSVSDRTLFDIANPLVPRQVQERNAQLLDCALPEMQRLRDVFGNADWIVACVDAQGLVVRSIGGESDDLRELRRAFRPGIDLSEQCIGTSAPGCALAEQRAVVIRAHEHFLDVVSPYVCAAVPLRDPAGDIAGALDVSYRYTPNQVDALELLSTAARAVENRLFSTLSDTTVLRFHYRPDMVETPYAALLAIKPDGTLVGASSTARAHLRLALGRLPQLSLDAVFDTSLSEWSSWCSRQDFPMRLYRHDGTCVYASIDRGPHAEATPAVRRHGRQVASAAPPSAAHVRAVGRESRSAGEVDMDYFLGDARLCASLEQAQRVFRRDVPVILLGETGTGKEGFARKLHETGPRRQGAFVAINCSALPASLIESELFGYEHGTFTGGRRGGAPGKFEQADNGTLFLDEIGDMSMELQSRLLRVLQERSVTRLGGSRPVPVRISLLCATHRCLRDLMAQGAFREDLFYRLNGLSVTLPPLRGRDDLRELIAWCLAQESTQDQVVRVSHAALEKLLQYTWPGNIRQLRNVLRTAAALAAEAEIQLEHLPDDIREPHSAVPVVPVASSNAWAAAPAGNGTLADSEMVAIRAALRAARGNVSAAARQLGIARATLYRKLKQMAEV